VGWRPPARKAKESLSDYEARLQKMLDENRRVVDMVSGDAKKRYQYRVVMLKAALERTRMNR